jgi:hypothetical protein
MHEWSVSGEQFGPFVVGRGGDESFDIDGKPAYNGGITEP